MVFAPKRILMGTVMKTFDKIPNDLGYQNGFLLGVVMVENA